MIFCANAVNASASILNVENNISYLSADYAKDYSKLDLLEEFDFSFDGVIIFYLSTSQYNGFGTNIPYSYFNLKV